jgi:hypothetical protein
MQGNKRGGRHRLRRQDEARVAEVRSSPRGNGCWEEHAGSTESATTAATTDAPSGSRRLM